MAQAERDNETGLGLVQGTEVASKGNSLHIRLPNSLDLLGEIDG